MIRSHFGDKLFYLVPALGSKNERQNSCDGCTFRNDNGSCRGPSHIYGISPTVGCYGNLVFIEGTDEAIAQYVNQRLDT